MAAAPTVPFTLRRQSARRLFGTILSRLGDRSLVRGRIHDDAEQTLLEFEPGPRAHGARRLRISWEQSIVAGALRDTLCAARAPLLWGWAGIEGKQGTPDATYPYLQRFPSPSELVFRGRLRIAARRWHFRVLDARYLQPLQGAPMVVVQAAHPVRLVRAAAAIERFLDPMRRNPSFQLGAWAYEGFYFEVEDSQNVPSFAFANAFRGTGSGSQWARSEELYPFGHG